LSLAFFLFCGAAAKQNLFSGARFGIMRRVSMGNPTASSDPVTATGQVTGKPFGMLPDGTAAELFTLRNANGAEARMTSYGGIVTHLFVPDRAGKLGDVVLGYDSLAGYLQNSPYFGCLVGRFGNRIADAKFSLEGKSYQLAKNDGANTLHGGLKGFDKVIWQAKPVVSMLGPALELRYLSPDGEEGYPGNLTVTAVYTLTHDNALRLDFTATTDQATVVNLTHHSYFNLAGAGDILNHELMIPAEQFTPVSASLIPTGELRALKGTPLDFSTPTKIGARINQPDEQLKLGRGYDHNFVLNNPSRNLVLAARVFEPTTGRVMEVETTEPATQFYSGNFLDGTITGKGGQVYHQRTGLCIEPQHFPDSPNQPAFPSTVLRPGETYTNTISYKFSVC
jgi:aldose 1-epimerase